MRNGEKWRIRHLEERDKIESFRCGDPDLDDFLLNDSKLYEENLLAVTYVLEISNRIMAYFSLANDSISIKDFNSNTEFNRFRKNKFINAKRMKSYPAVKICRFAVQESIKKIGIGSLLMDLIKVHYLENKKAGCRFITVDAYNSAIPFYERNGFLPLLKSENKTTSLMFYDLINAR